MPPTAKSRLSFDTNLETIGLVVARPDSGHRLVAEFQRLFTDATFVLGSVLTASDTNERYAMCELK